jgi:hypothetical protein
LLQDGRVLTVGGNSASGVTNTVELYNSNGTYSIGPVMHQARANAACVALPDGRVLVSGGTDGASALATAEVFDPAANAWTVTAGMSTPRSNHTATLLPWGAVLIAGGDDAGTVEAYTTAGQFLPVGKLSTPRTDYAVTALPNHKVLIIGGSNGSNPLSSIDVYDADKNTIAAGGQMLVTRKNFGAATLIDGTVLITGGYAADGSVLNTSEIYDPATGESMGGPAMAMARAGHQAYTLPNNGSVVLVGGTDGNAALGYSEIYTPWSGRFQSTPMNTPRSGLTAAMMRRGGLIVAGGRNGNGYLAGSEAYGFATVATDKLDYAPGEVASVTGTGFKPGELVTLTARALPVDAHNVEFTTTATADSNGQIRAGGVNIDRSHLGMHFVMTATGSESVAQVLFSDATATVTTITSITPPSPQTAPAAISIQTHVDQAAATGTIEILIDGLPGPNQFLDGATGNNQFNAVNLTVGLHSIVAQYFGDGVTYTGSTSTSHSYTVAPIGTSTSVLAQVGGAVNYGINVTITAAITTPTGTIPSGGNVQFFDTSNSNKLLGTVNYIQGTNPSLVVANLIPGVHLISATFNPPINSNYSGSTSAAGTAYTTTQVTPSFVLTDTPANLTSGQPFLITLTGSAAPLTSTLPTGNVQFSVGGNPVGVPTALNGGVASLSIPQGLPSSGSPYTVTAVYLGDAVFTGASPALAPNQVVSKGTPLVTVVTSPANSMPFGTSVTYTATVALPANAINSGLTFTQRFTVSDDNGNSCPLVALSAQNTVTCGPFTNLTAGPHVVTATYAPGNTDTNWATTANTAALTVTTATPQVVVTPAAGTVNLNQTDSISATVTLTPSSIGTVPGTVDIKDGATTVCSALALGAGNPATTTTACNPTLTTAGTHNFTAVYSGSGNVGGGTSPVSAVTVNKGTIVLSGLGTSSTITYGTSVSYTVTVTQVAATPNAGAFVQFYDNGNPIGSPVQAAAFPVGTATSAAITPSATPTLHNITAQFLGDTNYLASNTISGTTTTVNKAPATFSLTNFPITAAYGSSLAAASSGVPAVALTTIAGGSAATGTFTVFQAVNQIGGPYSLSGNPGTSTVTATLPTTIGVAVGLPLTITYSGDNNYASGTSSPTLTVTKANTTTQTLTSSGNPTPLNQTVTFTLNVAAAAGTPGGTANFKDGATIMNGAAVPVVNGVATFAISTLAAGNHTITADYLGDTNFNAVSAVALANNPQVIGAEATTTTVQASNVNPAVSQTVTYTITVAGVPNTPTGTVSLLDNGNAIGTCGSGLTLSSGVATCSIQYVGTGNTSTGAHTITSTYSPNAGFAASTATSFVVTVGANQPVTLGTLTVTSANPVQYGSNSSFSVPINPTAPTPAYAASSVQFRDISNGGAVLCNSSVAAGVATCTTTTPLTGGTHNIVAQFMGDANYPASTISNTAALVINKVATGNYTVTVNGDAGTTFTATTYGGTIFSGAETIALARPAGFAAGTLFPTGNVVATIGTTTIGSYPISASGIATLTTTTLPVSVNAGVGQSITFSYVGDTNYANDPPTGTITINKVTLGAGAYSLTSNPNPSAFGQNVTFTFSISTGIAGATPGGTVALLDNGNPLATVNVVNGVATYTTSALTNGNHTITVAAGGYTGDANFNANTTLINLTGQPQVVGAEATTTTVVPSTTNPTIGQTVTYTITTTGSPAVPAGTVQLTDNGNAICTPIGPTLLVSGSTTCTILYDGSAQHSSGLHSIVAVFAPTDPTKFVASTSVAQSIVVGGTATTTTALASSAGTTFTYGTLTNLSATVTATGVAFPVLPNFTGTVQFIDNYTPAGGSTITTTTLCGGAGQPACPIPSSANGLATLSNIALGGGTHVLTAIFTGDSKYSTSPAAATLTATVNRAVPVLTLNPAGPYTVSFGGSLQVGSITLAGVSQVGTAFAAPTGAITAAVGATGVGSAVAGAPTSTTGNYTFGVPTPVAIPTSLTPTGSPYGLAFTAAADANYSAVTVTPVLNIIKTTTAVTVTSPTIAAMPAGTTPVYGQPITLVATFATTGGVALAGGDTISFTDGVSALTGCTTVPIINNVATCIIPASTGAVPTLAVGVGHSVGAAALSAGDPNYTLGTVTQLGFNVAQAATTTLVSSLTNPSTPGQSVTFNATASVNLPGGEPLGTGQTITFRSAGAPLSVPCTAVAVNAAGQASCSFVFASAGNYNITATFSGDNNIAASTSALLVQSVGHPQPAITLTSSNPSSIFGAPVTFTSTVTGTNSVTPTGQIQFNDGATILGTVALSTVSFPAGTAGASITVSAPPMTAGSHAITAIYIPAGDPNYSTVTSTILNQTVTGSTTAITPVSISVNPAVFGQPVTLSVTVSPAVLPNSAVPGGTVTFYDGATAIGNPVTLVVGGTSSTATLNGVTLSVGSHASITAKYNGDANFSSVTSGSALLVVNRAATSTAITSISPTTASFGQTVTMTARVSVVAPGATLGATAPVGTISFYDGNPVASNLIGTSAAVDASGTATIQVPANATFFVVSPLVGTHNVIAVYNGGGASDPNFSGSTSPSSALSIGKTATTTVVSSSTGPSPSQSVTGQSVTFTATITPASGTFSAAPTGTVSFSTNGVPMGTGNVTVSGSVASAVLTVPAAGIPALADGTDLISANYSGDTNYNTSNSPATGAGAFQQVVSKASTTTQLSTSSNSTLVGQGVTLTAIVTVNAPGGGVPTGTVTFNNTVNNVPTAVCTAQQLNPAAGQNASNQFIASCQPNPALPQGSLQLTAVYSGDAGYTGSTSTVVTQVVNKPTTIVTVTASNNPILYGTPVTFSATVTPVQPGSNQVGPPITGTATWYDGVSLLGTSSIGGAGTTTFTAPLLAVGAHSISMQYGGDANYQGVIGDTLTENVNKLPSSITLTSNAINAVASQVVTFTAQINPFPPAGVPYPSGQVAFYDGSSQIGVGNLASGIATVSTATLGAGLHYISAQYVGDTDWTTAVSAYVPQNINLAQTTTQVVSSANPSVWGQGVTFTITTGVSFPGTVPANGLVQLYDNTVPMAAPVNIANGTTQITMPALTPGTHNIIAQYIGNLSFASSSSAPISQTVNKAPTVTALAALPSSSTSNQQITLTAVVTIPLPGTGTPTGTVQFMDTTGNGTIMGTAPLTSVGGVFTATITTSQLNQSGAPRLLTAAYSGDGNFATSTSAAQAESVFGTQIAVTNAAGYSATNFAPDSAAAVFVNNLVSTTLVAGALPLPTSLSGVTVTVTDSAGVARQAQLYFVSPSQINFLVPTNTAFGLANVTVTNASGGTAAGIILVTHTAPGIFTANQSGQGVAQALVVDVTPSGSQSVSNTAQYNASTGAWTAAPISMNSADTYVLELFGTGLRYVANGQATATINGAAATVQYAGAQPQYPGLDQVNILIPASLKGAGVVQVVVTIAGQAANTVTIAVN